MLHASAEGPSRCLKYPKAGRILWHKRHRDGFCELTPRNRTFPFVLRAPQSPEWRPLRRVGGGGSSPPVMRPLQVDQLTTPLKTQFQARPSPTPPTHPVHFSVIGAGFRGDEETLRILGSARAIVRVLWEQEDVLMRCDARALRRRYQRGLRLVHAVIRTSAALSRLPSTAITRRFASALRRRDHHDRAHFYRHTPSHPS